MADKFYAFYNPKTKENGIVGTWAECQKKTKNVSGVQYKKFNDFFEAEVYIEKLKQNKSEIENQEKLIHFYVDGSYRQSVSQKSGWGWVAVCENKKLSEDNGVTLQNALSRNIDGEIIATLKAVEWFFQKKNNQQFESSIQDKMILCYDYSGIENWAMGLWQAKTEVAKYYQNEIQKYSGDIIFKKIKSHSNDAWNDYVDTLAKKALD